MIAVMDLILNYPAADTAFIGLFMTAHDRQGCGLAAASSGTAWPGCLPPGITGCDWRWMRAILRAWPSGPRTASPSPVRSTPMIFRLSPYGTQYLKQQSPPANAGEGSLLQHLPHHAAAVGPDSAVMLWRWSIYMARSNRSRTVRGWLASVKSPSSTTMAWSRLPGGEAVPVPK